MSETLSFWEARFLWRDPVLAAVIAACGCAYVGVFIVLRRGIFVSAAVTQASGFGVVLALLAPKLGLPTIPPLAAGIGLGTVSSLLFGISGERTRIGADGVIAAVYLTTLALGVVLGAYLTHEYSDVRAILMGEAVAIRQADLAVLAATVVLVLGLHLGFRNSIASVTYDPEVASVHSAARSSLASALLFLTAGLVASVGTYAIGALPVFAFLVLPPLGALMIAERLHTALLLSVGLACTAAAGGYYVSFVLSLPTGATMAVAASLSLAPGLLRTLAGRAG